MWSSFNVQKKKNKYAFFLVFMLLSLCLCVVQCPMASLLHYNISIDGTSKSEKTIINRFCMYRYFDGFTYTSLFHWIRFVALTTVLFIYYSLFGSHSLASFPAPLRITNKIEDHFTFIHTFV